jgi:hypothetical protein
MPAARADHVLGPYEVNQAISLHEDFGMASSKRTGAPKNRSPSGGLPPPPNMTWRCTRAASSDARGEWWGFSMMDFNSVGRLLGLSPITWKDGWPYFGLPGNLTRTPRTWVKPKTATPQPIRVPFRRSDDFSGAAAPAPVAVEPCPGRRQVVAVGTAGLPAASRPAGDHVLRRAQHPDPAGDRADVDADRPARRVEPEAGRHGRPWAAQPALCDLGRRKARRRARRRAL